MQTSQRNWANQPSQFETHPSSPNRSQEDEKLPKAADQDTKPSRWEYILVVDDELWTAEVVCEQLNLEGFHADLLTDSTQVMDMLQTNHYDLVVLDIYMPPPDGLTLLREIQQKDPFLPVLMLTAFSDAETATKAMREGASDYIVKPYHGGQLTVRIERALERGKLLRERAHARELLERRVNEQTHQLREQSKQLSQMLDRVIVTYQATVKALEAALDVRDQSAPGHCRRVAKLAVRLATRMGIKGNDLIALEHGALLHDIGKLGVQDRILMKPGPLTEEEWQIMFKHPEIGCQIVSHIDFLQDALPIIRHHHEHYDGTGYPGGLKGADIPILARIFTVVDSFDAQTHQRPYNVVNSIQSALENLGALKGTMFDPQVVELFIEMIEREVLYAQEDEHIMPPPSRKAPRSPSTGGRNKT
jgi:putative nucleotidyltransferase with HDIG domain